MVIELKAKLAQAEIRRARQSRENSDLVMEIAAAQLAAARAREDGQK